MGEKKTICDKNRRQKFLGVIEDGFNELEGDELLPKNGQLYLTEHTRKFYTWEIKNE